MCTCLLDVRDPTCAMHRPSDHEVLLSVIFNVTGLDLR